MSMLLLWLAAPLLALPWLARRGQFGGAAGQTILAGAGLAALYQGTATLAPPALRAVAGQSGGDGWFVGISAGIIIAGGCLFPHPTNWRKVLLGIPLLSGCLFAASSRPGAILVGMLIGSLPAAFAYQWHRARSSSRSGSGVNQAFRVQPLPLPSLSISLLGVLAVVAALAGPAAVSFALLAAVVWRQWWITRASRPIPLLPVVATTLMAAWCWFALTIAETPAVGLRRLAAEAPISPAAEPLLALLAIGWGIAIAAPWPLDRRVHLAVQLPVLVLMLHLAGADLTPDGLQHWQALFTALGVVVALTASSLGRWDGAASALAILATTRGGLFALGTALALGLVPLARSFPVNRRLQVALGGVAAASAVVVLLRDQVVLAVILALGLAAVANRSGAVAPP